MHNDNNIDVQLMALSKDISSLQYKIIDVVENGVKKNHGKINDLKDDFNRLEKDWICVKEQYVQNLNYYNEKLIKLCDDIYGKNSSKDGLVFMVENLVSKTKEMNHISLSIKIGFIIAIIQIVLKYIIGKINF